MCYNFVYLISYGKMKKKEVVTKDDDPIYTSVHVCAVEQYRGTSTTIQQFSTGGRCDAALHDVTL